MAPTRKALENWTTADVSRWLDENNFSDYTDELCEKHKFDGNTLLNLSEDDLRGPPVNMPVLGDIKRMMKNVSALRYDTIEQMYNDQTKKPANASKRKRRGTDLSEEDDLEDGLNSRGADYSGESVSEVSRTVVSVLYVVFVFLLTSFVMTVVHDRVPDMKTYPPLPDIILDNVPFIPWAFDLCEMCAIVLGVMWAVVLILHKHRLVLLRRICALFGTVFLLRCFTMYVTSMSVPGVHLECSSKIYGDFNKRLTRALEIFFGMGMSLSGVRSCGDYMFSGHTSTVTLLNFFVTEYTPRRWYFLHTFCWILNAFAVFFILAAHEHYTIDVVIAFYISSRLFLYYHTLACAQPYLQGDRKRTRIWFPLFWFFERNSVGRIPNEYEWPISFSKIKWLVGLITGQYNHANKSD